MKLSEPKKKEIARSQIQRRLQKRAGRRAGSGSESLREKDRGISAMGGYLVGGQVKLDKNKNGRIDAQDFKILKAEKAKGRGKGLQDEKMKPGKVMKAMVGVMAIKKAADKVSKESGMPKGMGLGIGMSAIKAKKMKEILGRKMGGKIMKARKGVIIKPKGPGVIRPKPQDRYGQQFKPTPIKPKKKMGGGMMMRPNPVGMKSGKSVKVKCKLGRNKPTKMY